MTKKTGLKSRAMRALGVSTILSTLVLPLAAHAAEPQEAMAPAPDQPADQSAGLGEIVVTATREATSIQKVPISMQALSTEVLAQRQIKGLTDFAALLPSVTFAGIGPGRNTPYFRGIVPAGGARESVGYYIDDIPITGTGLPDVHVYDIARIEALSGPQGTLYGAGSLAGTIRFISNKPKLDTFEFGYDAEVNKYGKGDIGGNYQTFINVPISSTLAVRAMGFYRKDGGYVDNLPNNGKFADGSPSILTLGDNNPNTSFTLNNSDIAQDDYNTIEGYGGRLQVLWEPADGWSIMPQVTAQKQIAAGYFGFDPRVGDLAVHDYDITEQNDQFYQAALTINGHIGDWDIVSATGYYQRQVKLLNDYTYYTVAYDGVISNESYLQFFDQNGCSGTGATLKCTSLINPTQFYRGLRNEKKFTQELRISTPKSWPFNVTFGGFYHRQNNEINNDYSINGLDKIVGYTDGGGGDSNPAGFGIPTSQGGTMILGTNAVKRDAYYATENNNNWSDYALFAEGHYNITPELKVTGGIRFFRAEYDIIGFAGIDSNATNRITTTYVPTGAKGCPVPIPDVRLNCLNTNFAAADQTGRYKESGETHKIALNWQFDPSKMLYANYSTGFRPGGYSRPLNIRSVGVVTVPNVLSETLTNYELGFKGTWNNMFRFNAAVYMEDWDNIQYSVVVAGAQGAGITGNAGKARVYGVEFDADLKLGAFTLSTSGAYNDGKLRGTFCNFALDRSSLAITQLQTCASGQTVVGTTISQVAAENGTRLPRQPKFKGTSSIRYDTKMGDADAYMQGAALYQTSATQNLNVLNNNLLGNTAGFVSFDFSAGIKKNNWTLDVFLQNAFDKRGELTRNTFCSIEVCSDAARTFTIKPQFFGIRWGQRY